MTPSPHTTRERRTPSVAHTRGGTVSGLAGLVGLVGVALAAPALGSWLVAVALGLARPGLRAGLDLGTRLQVVGVERAVAVPILLVGAVVVARLTVHALLALGYVLAVRSGRTLPRLRRVVAERAPGVVRALARRAAGTGVAMSLGAGLALAGTASAMAAPGPALPHAAPAAHDAASDTGSAARSHAAAHPDAALDLGWHAVVTKSATAPAEPRASTPPADRAAAEPASHVTVRHGDTLWAIAAAHLGPGASDADVARAWPRWYAANRDAIGADPDLLLPGTRLVVPPEAS